MKKLIVLLLGLASAITPQDIHYYVASYTSSITGASDTLTIQSPVGATANVHFMTLWVYCSAACSFRIYQNGTAATTTSFTPSPFNGAPPSQSSAYSASNVGTGKAIGQPYQLTAAGSTLPIDISKLFLNRAGTVSNLSVVLTSGTLTWTPSIMYSEQ